ncbi:hypothetical protein LJC09_02850 [Desulfovibrio sp. OttesenSCG-928-F20]|nr:hypothetical protein [Desulfovibrio sp. OttesenSCG-928-F20]
MVNFWSPLLRCLVNKGHEPLCLVPPPAPGDDPSWEQALAALGVRVEHYPLDRKGLNPVRDLGSLAALTGILRREQPDRLFAFTIKAVIYGCLAAALAACPPRQQRFAMISGLGYMFEGDTRGKRLLTQLARLLYRLALQCCGVVIFQNEDDRKLFEKLSIIPRTTHIRSSRGTGVDTEFFALAPQAAGPPIFLFVGRLLEAKGLRDFMAAARIVRQQHPEAQFHVLGPPRTWTRRPAPARGAGGPGKRGHKVPGRKPRCQAASGCRSRRGAALLARGYALLPAGGHEHGPGRYSG